MDSRKRPFSDDEFRQFRDWIAGRFGISYGEEKREMLRVRLEPRRAALGLERYRDLLFHLKFHPEREAEIERLLPHLTNNESFFFRERPPLEVFERQVLPELLGRTGARGARQLRVMSAACATGEEAYTLAMLSRRDERRQAEIRITGLDVDPIALGKARTATYGAHSLRGVSEADRRRHFLHGTDDRWTVRSEFRDHVTFVRANLLSDDWVDGCAAQDVIFCRNVLIYFADSAIQTVIDNLNRALRPGGYLFLGHAETLRRVESHPFEVIRQPGCVFYRKVGRS